MALTLAQRTRAIRQDELREKLAAGGHLDHVLDLCQKLEEQGDAAPIAAWKVVIDTKLRLINKYLPDLKSVELSGEGGGALLGKWRVEIVRSEPEPPAP